MKVILLKDVPKVGRKNEVKEVSDGFARNFLISRNLAMPATDSAIKRLSADKEKQDKEIRLEKETYLKIADKLNQTELKFKMKVGGKGKTFGSVTPADIQGELGKKGIKLDKEWIALEQHIKTTGERVVDIKFPRGITGKLKISLEAE